MFLIFKPIYIVYVLSRERELYCMYSSSTSIYCSIFTLPVIY